MVFVGTVWRRGAREAQELPPSPQTRPAASWNRPQARPPPEILDPPLSASLIPGRASSLSFIPSRTESDVHSGLLHNGRNVETSQMSVS